jgi:hypothetical protein
VLKFVQILLFDAGAHFITKFGSRWNEPIKKNMSEKRRQTILTNQIFPNLPKKSQNESASYFQDLDQGILFESRINVIHVKEILSRIGNLLHDIYFLIEQDEIEVKKPDLWTSFSNFVFFTKSDQEIQEEYKEEIKDLPYVPITASVLFWTMEAFLQICKILNLLVLYALVRFHKYIERMKPKIIENSYLFQKKLSDLELNPKIIFSSQISRLLSYLRQRQPKRYYQFMSIYLKVRNVILIPRDMMRSIFWIFPFLYLRMLFLPSWLFETVTPSIFHIGEKKWSEFYIHCKKFVDVLRKSEVYKELN